MNIPQYPFIDPVLVQIGPFEVRWYGMMYLGGFFLAYLIIRAEFKRRQGPLPPQAAEDFLFYLILGVLIGGRLGYVLFYNLPMYLEAPWEIIAVWHGGMSFHGGLIGMVCFGYVFARKHHAPFWELADIGALAAPPGLMLGRIGNFINGELYGRITDLPWGIVFPQGGDLPRHPSQLYESALEGPVLFAVLWVMRRRTKHPGELLCLFLMGYGVARFAVEFVREPDPQLGFVLWILTMGQLLCFGMILAGGFLFTYFRIKSTKTRALSSESVKE